MIKKNGRRPRQMFDVWDQGPRSTMAVDHWFGIGDMASDPEAYYRRPQTTHESIYDKVDVDRPYR